MKEIIECPNCGAQWTLEEIEERECFACGFPECHDEEDFDLDPDDFDSSNEGH